MTNPNVIITMEDGGDIVVELYPDKAPNTVNNFLSLASSGFYDGLTFHRIINGFMIQGGDPVGNGTGGPGYTIKGEFSLNGCKSNDIKHARGVISMARAMSPNSAGSQFFIMHANASYLDGQYAAFGRVIAGMDGIADLLHRAAGDIQLLPETLALIYAAAYALRGTVITGGYDALVFDDYGADMAVLLVTARPRTYKFCHFHKAFIPFIH